MWIWTCNVSSYNYINASQEPINRTRTNKHAWCWKSSGVNSHHTSTAFLIFQCVYVTTEYICSIVDVAEYIRLYLFESAAQLTTSSGVNSIFTLFVLASLFKKVPNQYNQGFSCFCFEKKNWIFSTSLHFLCKVYMKPYAVFFWILIDVLLQICKNMHVCLHARMRLHTWGV